MDEVIVWIASIGGFGVAFIILFAGAAELRDDLVSRGWASRNSRLGRMSVRAQREKIKNVLDEIGFKEHHFEGIAWVGDREASRRRLGSSDISLHPDQYLLKALKPWARTLESPYSFEGTGRYYIDSMGAIHDHLGETGTSLIEIFDAWLSYLRAADAVPSFDCILTNKDGNPFLAKAVADRIFGNSGVRTIVCKGRADPSMVKRDAITRPHVTDFEGLEAFMSYARSEDRAARSFTAIAIDDNCTTGGSLASAIQRFNQLVRENSVEYPIRPITEAVLLFVVKHGATRGNFESIGIRLHALLSLGEDEMKRIRTEPIERLIKDIPAFKVDEFACTHSRALR